MEEVKKTRNLTPEEKRAWILENCINEDGDIDLSDLDFSKINRNVNISCMKVKGSLYQFGQEVEKDLYQDLQKVEKDLYQDHQSIGNYLYQHSQGAKKIIQDINGE